MHLCWEIFVRDFAIHDNSKRFITASRKPIITSSELPKCIKIMFGSSYSKQCLDLELVYRIRSATITNRYELPVDTELAPTRMKSTRRSQQNGNKFELHLQFMSLFIMLKIFRLVECVLFDCICRMFGFHHYMSSRFPLIGCLRRPA